MYESLSWILDLLPEILPNILGIILSSWRWSEMVAVKLPDIMAGSTAFENILSIRVLEWLVILLGYKIKGINELEARESKNSFVWLCSLYIIQEVNIKIFK